MIQKNKVCAIFAIGPNNIIGIGDKLPWKSKKDFIFFKKTTSGYPCIFGDRTFFGLPEYPLKNRLNIVCNPNFTEGIVKNDSGFYIQENSIENAINLVNNYKKIFICGGASIYKYCLENNLIDVVYLTRIESKELKLDDENNPNKYIKFPLNIEEVLKTWECTEIDKYEFLDTKFLYIKENLIDDIKFLKYSKK